MVKKYNEVHCTVFDKNGNVTEYNCDYNILRVVGWKHWISKIYGNIGQLVFSFNDRMTWVRYDGGMVPLIIEHSTGVVDRFKYHDNNNVLFHKRVFSCGSEYHDYYDESGNRIKRD